MTVEYLGFYRELPHGDPAGPSLLECLFKGDESVKSRIAVYLDGGTMLATTGQVAFDVMSNEDVIAGDLAIKTDGVWVWPADLSYYVRTYNVSLTPQFIERAANFEWKAPRVDTSALEVIENAMMRE